MLRLALVPIAIAGSATIAASAPVVPQGVPVDVQLRQARAEAAAAIAEQQRLEKLAAEARGEVERLRAKQLAAAQAIAAAEAAISAADAQARLIQARLEIQRQRLAREQAPASALLTALYMRSQRPPLLLMAQSGSTQELLKLRALVSAVTPAIRERAAALAKELDAAQALQTAASAAREERLQTRNALAKRRDAFAELEAEAIEIAERRGTAALGAGDTALARSDILAESEESARTARGSARLARELAEIGPAPLPPQEPAPYAPLRYRLPADAAVVEGLGAIDANGVRARGVTLATRRGARLVAPADGTILFAGPFRDYDGILIIDHGSGWKSVLVNAGTDLRKGARVKIGDSLGIALGRVEVQLMRGGEAISPALIAGSSRIVSNKQKSG